ncbi:MAG: DUF2917 domain-containing protein [bacterium]|nr:DUF2917 domain-containing protein [bacterium]MDT8365392.1 DUF2917 domain-containing protein [bacterium]
MVISMNRDDMVSLRNSLGTITVRCAEGAVWVTVSGDSTDYILSPGKELTVSIKGKIVIMAEKSSLLRLFRPVTPGALVRMGLNTIPANHRMEAR